MRINKDQNKRYLCLMIVGGNVVPKRDSANQDLKQSIDLARKFFGLGSWKSRGKCRVARPDPKGFKGYAVDKKLTSEIRAVGGKVDGHEDRIRFLERKVA